MTGHAVCAHDLMPGDIIHRERHKVCGQWHGGPELDVQITGKHVTGPLVTIDWQEPATYLGAQATVTGVTVYDLATQVLVIGHAA